MPNSTRQMALQTWLILVPVMLIVMGVINGAAVWLMPADLHPPVVSLPLMVLAGVGLLAMLMGWQGLAWLSAAALLLMGLHGPLLALFPDSPLQYWPLPMTSATSVVVLLLSLCLLLGVGSPRARLIWLVAGLIVTLVGGLSVLGELWPGAIGTSPWGSAFSSAFTALPGLLCGTAMLLLARGRPSNAAAVQRAMVLSMAGGVLASGLAWSALTWQQHDAQRRQADQLLSNFKVAAEQAMDARQLQLVRMAERWEQLGGLPDPAFRELELEAIFRDTPSLVALHWQDEQERFRWGRQRGDSPNLAEWLDRDGGWLLDWLAVGGSYPRWVLPDPARPSLALVAVPLPEPAASQLVAVIDLEMLLSEDVRSIVTPLILTVRHGAGRLLTNSEDHGEPGAELGRGLLVLPGGMTLETRGHAVAAAAPSLGGLLPLGVGIGGLTLSYLLAFSLGLAGVSTQRSLTLAMTQRHLRAQQRVQTMVAQDKPLPEILQAICRLVEAQSPGALSSIMLASRDGQRLDRIFSISLPKAYLEAVSGVDVHPEAGACGRAAHTRDFVICRDLASDPLWRGFHDLTAAHGLRACWSYPVIASDGRLLGTFATYFREPGEPDANDRRRIVEAAELVALAVEREQNRRALRESEQRYRSLFAYHPDAVFSLDLEGHFLTANSACSELTGYPLKRLIGMHFGSLIDTADRQRIEQRFLAAGRGEAFRYSLEVRRRDGHSVFVDLTNLPIIVDDRVIGLYGIAKDMTERHERETELRILQRSVEASINGVVIADAREPGMPLIYVNESFERITGYRRDEVLGRSCRLLQGSETDPAAVQQLREALAQRREINVTLLNYRKDGSPFWNNLFLAPVRDGVGVVTHFVGVQHDISERKAYEAKLAFHASHDALTGLANRSLFEDHLIHDVQLAQRHDGCLAVLFVDLDDFKPINDSLGHEIGDQVLIQVARRLGDELSPGDTLARFGGDEFLVLLPELRQEDDALSLAERLLTCISRPYRVQEHELYLSASVGVAFLREELANPVALIQQADMAMYRAKQKGRNAWECFTGEINDEVSSRMALRNDLQEAIEAGSFELHYQPLLNADDGSVAGFEALVRWKHPQHGYLSPGLFIPLAEDTGQIVPISEWVLRQACRDMRRLEAEGLGRYRVSVNLSPLQFHRPHFLANLQQALQETGLDPECLELELTEGILMNDTDAAIETLRALREMGVEVSIDDFGTGYSSLSYLKQLPIGKIKIDRSFIRDVTTSPHDSAIVQGIISMAHHLGLEVVAEGIEEVQQRDYLAAHGCDVFQGFYFARPMPLEQLSRFLVERRPARGIKVSQATADR